MDLVNLKEHLDKLLSGDYVCIELGYIAPDSLEEQLKTIEGVNLKKWGDFDTNGWAVDFWFTFSYNDIELIFSGSWYYGHYRISKN